MRRTIWERAIDSLVTISGEVESSEGCDVVHAVTTVQKAVEKFEIRAAYGGAEEQNWPARIMLAMEYMVVYLPNEKHRHRDGEPGCPRCRTTMAADTLKVALWKMLQAVRAYDWEVSK